MNDPARTWIDEPSPWEPESNALTLKYIGKLGEELNECGSAIFRCVIQGVDGREPSTGEVNRDWLAKEIADVLANVALVIDHLQLDREAIEKRRLFKTAHLLKWHTLVAQSNDAEAWRPPDEAPFHHRLIAGWRGNGALEPHVELGIRKSDGSWVNTYGKPFSGAPDCWRAFPMPQSNATTDEGSLKS